MSTVNRGHFGRALLVTEALITFVIVLPLLMCDWQSLHHRDDRNRETYITEQLLIRQTWYDTIMIYELYDTTDINIPASRYSEMMKGVTWNGERYLTDEEIRDIRRQCDDW